MLLAGSASVTIEWVAVGGLAGAEGWLSTGCSAAPLVTVVWTRLWARAASEHGLRTTVAWALSRCRSCSGSIQTKKKAGEISSTTK